MRLNLLEDKSNDQAKPEHLSIEITRSLLEDLKDGQKQVVSLQDDLFLCSSSVANLESEMILVKESRDKQARCRGYLIEASRGVDGGKGRI